MSDEIVRVEHLKKYFDVRGNSLIGKKKIVKAVDDVSFTIHKGEILGVVGESGCGKSTLGRCVLRLMNITDGNIYFKGDDISRLREKDLKKYREKMQMVFQNPYSSFNPTMSIRQSFFEIGKVFHLGTEETEKRCKDLMENIRLPEDLINRHPNELSGGQLQRLAIARALLLKPDFIMADEAVSALDVSVQAQILNLLLELRKSLGLTMMFISHELTVVEHVCDEILVMYLGTVVEKASAEELFQNILHPYTQALISAKPKEHPAMETHRIILEGEAKSAMDAGTGCKFAPRCRFFQKGKCDVEMPELREVSSGHFVACHAIQGKAEENG
nr:ABC transporter ATP-binding protein [uncultured Merdimonas sp.]